MRMQKKKNEDTKFIYFRRVWELNMFIYIKLLKQSWKAVFSSIKVRCDNNNNDDDQEDDGVGGG